MKEGIATAQIWSIQHLRQLDNHVYRNGGYVFNESGEVFTVDEAIDILSEICEDRLYYAINWEGEIWSESGLLIESVYSSN